MSKKAEHFLFLVFVIVSMIFISAYAVPQEAKTQNLNTKTMNESFDNEINQKRQEKQMDANAYGKNAATNSSHNDKVKVNANYISNSAKLENADNNKNVDGMQQGKPPITPTTTSNSGNMYDANGNKQSNASHDEEVDHSDDSNAETVSQHEQESNVADSAKNHATNLKDNLHNENGNSINNKKLKENEGDNENRHDDHDNEEVNDDDEEEENDDDDDDDNDDDEYEEEEDDNDDDDDDDDDDDYLHSDLENDNRHQSDEDRKGKLNAIVHTIFPNASSPIYATFPAGTTSHALIAYQNNEANVNHTIVLALGFLQPSHKLDVIIQNFSVVRHGRVVHPHETANIRYSFTPDEYFEPGEYNLVLGLFVNNQLTNETNLVTAFNSTILIEDVIGTDARTILTYITMLTFLIGAMYLIARRYGIDKKIHHFRQNGVFATLFGKRSAKSGSSSSNTINRHNIEAGTSGESYDPEFVSAEHLRYRDKILNRSASNSQKLNRPHSGSPKKTREGDAN